MTSSERRALGGLIAPAFHEAHKAVRRGQVGELVLTGGRGSAKSSCAAIELLVQLMRHPDCHAVALRRVGRTLRTSVWSQLLWALDRLGLEGEFAANASRLELVRKSTGQQERQSVCDRARPQDTFHPNQSRQDQHGGQDEQELLGQRCDGGFDWFPDRLEKHTCAGLHTVQECQ